jgi:hypothetical protein
MNDNTDTATSDRRRRLWYRDGKIYFSREGERRFFFVLTLVMLGLGISVKLGLW